jgi:outer membrane protein assembly factor BamB
LLLLACPALLAPAAPGDIAPGWPVATSGAVFGAPAIGPHGEVVVGSQDRNVYSYNPDGSLRWIHTTSDWIESSPTIAADGTVYVGSWDNFLYALDSETGNLKWKFETGSLIIASPAVGPDGTIFVGSYDGLLYALDAAGNLRWTCQPWTLVSGVQQMDAGAITGGPVLNSAGNTVYFGTENGNLYAVSAANGTQQWYFKVPHLSEKKEISAPPAVDPDGRIVFSCQNGYVYALWPSGSLNWSFQTPETVRSSPVIDSGGIVYFAAQDGYLYAVDTIGFQLWETFVGDVFYCSPALDADGNIIIGAYAGSAQVGAASVFMALDSQGLVKWEYIIEGYNDSSPNISSDGSIYIGAHDGFIYKLEGGAPLMQTGWPRLQASRRQTGLATDLQETELIDFFPAVSSATSHWVHVPWFSSGWLTDANLPWIQHLDHGFIYLFGASAWAINFYDSALGEWLYAPTYAPGFYYRYKSGSWLYHLQGTSVGTGRWFYDYGVHGWFAESMMQ